MRFDFFYILCLKKKSYSTRKKRDMKKNVYWPSSNAPVILNKF